MKIVGYIEINDDKIEIYDLEKHNSYKENGVDALNVFEWEGCPDENNISSNTFDWKVKIFSKDKNEALLSKYIDVADKLIRIHLKNYVFTEGAHNKDGFYFEESICDKPYNGFQNFYDKSRCISPFGDGEQKFYNHSICTSPVDGKQIFYDRAKCDSIINGHQCFYGTSLCYFIHGGKQDFYENSRCVYSDDGRQVFNDMAVCDRPKGGKQLFFNESICINPKDGNQSFYDRSECIKPNGGLQVFYDENSRCVNPTSGYQYYSRSYNYHFTDNIPVIFKVYYKFKSIYVKWFKKF